MSNKTQLQANNEQLASLIQTLQGKAQGGGSAVETCTVKIVDTGEGKSAPEFETVYITGYDHETGLVFTEMTFVTDGAEFDVVSGSYIFLGDGFAGTYISDVTNGDIVNNAYNQFVVKATAAAGETVTISAYNAEK